MNSQIRIFFVTNIFLFVASYCDDEVRKQQSINKIDIRTEGWNTVAETILLQYIISNNSLFLSLGP